MNETRRPVVITQRELREATLLLTLIAQGEADVRAGRTASQNEVFAAGRARVCKRPATSPFEPVR